ncbi:NUDIX hydrolase [candidate division WOR-3 bacterium]|nr:NUDIX hydrolase [candidate division WOR-3 bacterium]
MEKQVSRNSIYKGRIINLFNDVVLLEDGTETEREVVEHRGAVACLPFINREEVLLIKQYRYPVQREVFEIPAGIIELGEKPELTVRRELLEETGYSSNNIDHLCRFYTSPGYSDEIIYLYFAYNLKKEKPNRDYDENITVKLLPLCRCLDMIKEGEICDAKTIIALLVASLRTTTRVVPTL